MRQFAIGKRAFAIRWRSPRTISRVDKACHAAKKPIDLGNSGPGDDIIEGPSVKNDWENEMELLSTEDLEREVARLKFANERLREKLIKEPKSQAGGISGRNAALETSTKESLSEIHAGPVPVSKNEEEAPRFGSGRALKMDTSRMSIIFVSSEVAPWSKTGGLGDVAGSLPVALAELGHRVMVVAPRYLNGVTDGSYDCASDMQCQVPLSLGHHGHEEVKYFHALQRGVDWVFVDHPCYHRAGGPYGDELGVFGDNVSRFAILSMAACEAALHVHILDESSHKMCVYGQEAVFIANDWHAGLVPVYIRELYQPAGVFQPARCLLAIHNLAHQGIEAPGKFDGLGLPGDSFKVLEWIAKDGHQSINILKGAIATTDQLVTVSTMHALDMTSEGGSMGLHPLLYSRSNVLSGIINGIDTEEWNPETDEFINSRYSYSKMSGKLRCKTSLQKELGFDTSPDTPLIGFVGRLDHQKGPDLVLDALELLGLEDCQVVMLGSGDKTFEGKMKEKELQHRDFFCGWVGYSVPVSHKIIAGCDILLIPSRFEPCGLIQLYAQRYGTVPVAHATGGLQETIQEFNPFGKGKEMRGTGFTFQDPTVESMMEAIRAALRTYRDDPEGWTALRGGMLQDFSWAKSAKMYESLLFALKGQGEAI